MPAAVGAARSFTAGLLAMALLLLVAGPVSAHAEIVSADPAPNAGLVEGPSSLSITFSEPIDPATARIELLDAQQIAVEGVGEAVVSRNGSTVTVALPALEPNIYTVRWQVVSTSDGHSTAGFYAFLVDPTGAAPPPTNSASSSSPSVDPFTVAARWLALISMLVAFGSLVMWRNAGRGARPPWALVLGASVAAAVGVAAYLALSARPVANDGGVAGTGIPLDIAAAFGWTPFAIAMRVAFLAAFIGAVVACLALVRSWVRRWAGVTAAVVLGVGLAAMSLAGHAATGGIGFAAIDWLHLLAVSAWLGGLPAALLLARDGRTTYGSRLREILRRHGRVALIAAPVVALTGVANSPIVLGSSRDLVASDYGNLLVAKAGLLAVALGIGAVNHLVLRSRGRAHTTALLGAELVVAVLAVSAAATMVTIQPASARQPELAGRPVNPAHFFGNIGPLRAHVSVSVPAPGDQAYRVVLTDAETGGPRDDVQKVFLSFEPPEGVDLPAERVELSLEPADRLGGLYAANGAFTPLDGDWGMALIVRRAGELDESLPFVLPVRTPPTPELGPPPDTGVGVPAPLAAAWSLLPAGALGWVPALAALVALVLLGLLRPSAARGFARGVAVAALLVAVGAAGTRSLVALANAPSAAELATAALPASSPDIATGESLYRANCASCHGVRADGDGPVSTQPDAGPLTDAVAQASDAELSYRISYGIAGTPMPPFAGLLSAEDRVDLIAYLRTLVPAD